MKREDTCLQSTLNLLLHSLVLDGQAKRMHDKCVLYREMWRIAASVAGNTVRNFACAMRPCAEFTAHTAIL
jgi:hypothetical protein